MATNGYRLQDLKWCKDSGAVVILKAERIQSPRVKKKIIKKVKAKLDDLKCC